MQENERIIRDFIEAWSRLDAKELAAYFTEDGAYHNMPTDPVVGRANVEKNEHGYFFPFRIASLRAISLPTYRAWEISEIAQSRAI